MSASDDKERPRVGDWRQCVSGRQVWCLDYRPEDVSITDIAHSLSNIHRFGGESNLSVAQHSVHVSEVLQSSKQEISICLWGLLHDTAEGIVGIDMPRPVKRHLLIDYQGEVKPYTWLEDKITQVIIERFGLTWPMPESVHHADNVMLATEARWLYDTLVDNWKLWELPEVFPIKLEAWTPERARREFLQRFVELGGKE